MSLIVRHSIQSDNTEFNQYCCSKLPSENDIEVRISSLKKLYHCLEVVENDADVIHSIRRRIFSDIALLYAEIINERSKFGNGENCLLRAERLQNDLEFVDFPGCQNRLRPFASAYLNQFKEFGRFVCAPRIDLDEAKIHLKLLGRAHIQFIDQYRTEFKQAYKSTISVVKEVHSDAIMLFTGVFYSHLTRLTEKEYAQAALGVVNADPEYLFLIPKLAIAELLIKESTTEQLPRIFQAFAADFSKLDELYGTLSEEEEIQLYQSLVGTDGDFSEKVKELSSIINEVAVHFQRGQQAEIAATLFSIVYSELKQGIYVAEEVHRFYKQVGSIAPYTNPYYIIIYSLITSPKIIDKDNLAEALQGNGFNSKLDFLQNKYRLLSNKEKEEFRKIVFEKSRQEGWLARPGQLYVEFYETVNKLVAQRGGQHLDQALHLATFLK